MIISPDIFSPGGVNHTRMFLILFCLTLAFQVIISFGKQLRYFKTLPTKIYGQPQLLFSKFKIPKPNEFQFIMLGILFALCLILAALNFYPRFFLLVSFLCYFPYFNSIQSLAFIQRKTNLIPIILFILLFAPSINAPLETAVPLFPIVLIKIAISQIYFSAGLQKLINSGLSWCDGKSLQAYLLEHYLWGDKKSALILAQHQSLCMVSSVLILLFELTFWVIIFLPQLTYIYAIGGLLFHFGTLITMQINYLKYLSPVYMVFATDLAFSLKKYFGF